MRESLRTQLKPLFPVLVSLLFGVLCAYLVLLSSIGFYEITPFPEGITSWLNAFLYVLLTATGATILYILLKRKKLKLINFIIGFALSTAVFMLTFVYTSAAMLLLSLPYVDILAFTTSIAVTIIADFIVFRVHRFSNLAILLLGGALGAFLGVTIPPLSAILILLFLAVYDVFAVYRGPVGKIAKTGLDKLHGLSVSFNDVQMGLGDLTFYAMLISEVLASTDIFYCLASITGIMAGVWLAFKMLEKKGMFPGLPFPIALGLLPLIIAVFF